MVETERTIDRKRRWEANRQREKETKRESEEKKQIGSHSINGQINFIKQTRNLLQLGNEESKVFFKAFHRSLSFSHSLSRSLSSSIALYCLTLHSFSYPVCVTESGEGPAFSLFFLWRKIFLSEQDQLCLFFSACFCLCHIYRNKSAKD